MPHGSGRRGAAEYSCLYCGEPLPFTKNGVKAWRVGDKFVCNEFCADGISPSSNNSKSLLGDADRWSNPTD
jgi:hypothetical protein